MEKLVNEISKKVMDINTKGNYIAFMDIQGHVDNFGISIRDKKDYTKKLYEENFVYYKGSLASKEELTSILSKLEKFVTTTAYCQVWDQFKEDIEAEILEVLQSRAVYAKDLFNDVMIETDGHEISLDCVYQSYKLTGLINADAFKNEMLSNIEWLTNMIESSYDDQEDAV